MNDKTRAALVSEDSNSAKILKPILRGRDIERYRANWDGRWLIDTHNGFDSVPPVDVRVYPAVRAHLDSYFQNLEKRQDRGHTPYNLRNCAYHKEFQKPKLFWTQMTPYARFALVEPGVFCNDACFMITGEDLKYLSAILNSKLVTWVAQRRAVTTGMGLSQWKKYFVETIPIAVPDKSANTLLCEHVNSMLNAIDERRLANIVKIQEKIDEFVFDLYGLTGTERTRVTREVSLP